MWAPPTAPTVEPAAAPFSLEWSAPEDCPAQSSVEARIGALISERERSVSGIRAEVELRRSTEGYEGTLSLHADGGSSTRSLRAERCVSVAEATALLVAITVDPLATDRVLERERSEGEARAEVPGPPPTEPEPEPISPPVPEAATEDPTPQPRPTDREVQPPSSAFEGTAATLRVEAGGDLGLFPQPGVTVGAMVGLHRRWLRVGLTGRAWMPQRITHPLDATVAAELRAFSLGAQGCAGPRWSALELPVCFGVDAGAMRGEGGGALLWTGAVRRPWVALRLGPALAWSPIPAVTLWFGVDLATSLLRPQFHIASLGPIHQTGVVSGRAFVAVETRFGGRSARSDRDR